MQPSGYRERRDTGVAVRSGSTRTSPYVGVVLEQQQPAVAGDPRSAAVIAAAGHPARDVVEVQVGVDHVRHVARRHPRRRQLRQQPSGRIGHPVQLAKPRARRHLAQPRFHQHHRRPAVPVAAANQQIAQRKSSTIHSSSSPSRSPATPPAPPLPVITSSRPP